MKEDMIISRRRFLGTAAALGSMACLANVPYALAGNGQKKLRFAQIGCGGRGKDHHGMWRQHEFVAAVDTNKKTLNMFNQTTLPNLKRYSDYRKMYENHMDEIDAVIVATPDHHHYSAAMLGLMGGKAVFCEKPLAWSVSECLALAKMVKEKKLPSQMGNQGNAGMGWRNVYAIVKQDIIGKVSEVHTWTNRPIWPQGLERPDWTDPVPDTLDWDSWIGPAAMVPYADEWKDVKYEFSGKSVYNPQAWRGFLDFGCGALGDMACHTMNAMFQVMKPEFDCSVEMLKLDGPSSCQFPKKEIIKWSFAKAGDCPGFDAYWYDGNLQPQKPAAYGANPFQDKGVMFVGSKGVLYSGGDYNEGNIVYIDGQKIEKPTFEPVIKPSEGGMHGEFVAAAAGDKPWDSPMSNFMYAGKMSAIIGLGIVASKLGVGKKLTFSSATMKFDNEEANKLMARKPREGWEKAYKV